MAKTSAKSIFLFFNKGVTFLLKETFANCFSIEEGKPCIRIFFSLVS
jgi:hypothetical protein